MIILATLFNLRFPDKTVFVFQLISDITTFSVIPMDKLVNKLFTFGESKYDDDDAVFMNENFKNMGYDGPTLLKNLDTILVFLVCLTGAFILAPIIDVIFFVSNAKK